MKKSLLVLGSLFVTTFVIAQPALEWPARYNGAADNEDESHSIVVDNSGNVFVTGSAFNAAGTLDMVTIKYSPTGQQLWLQSYNGSGNDNDESREIAIDNNGDVVVVGYSKTTSNGTDITTIKYSNAGVQQWVATYNGAFNNGDQGNAVTIDGNNNVYVCGYETVSNYTYDFVTIKYDSGGNQQWVQTYNGPGNFNDEAKDIALDASGNVFVTGPSDTFYNSLPNSDIVLLKYNNSGTFQYRRVYDDVGHSYQYCSNLTIDRNGDVIVAGWGFITAQGYNIFVLKWTGAGVWQWLTMYNFGNNTFESPHDIISDSLNNIIVVGQGITTTSSNTNDYVTIKVNSSGTLLWSMRYDGGSTQEDKAYAVALDDSLNIFVTGLSKGTGTDFDAATVKYDAAGNQKYVLRYNFTANGPDYGNDIIVKNAIIYVTGKSNNPQNGDFITLKYSYAAVGIDEQDPFASLEAYPNPAHDQFTILLGGGHSHEISYEVLNTLGERMNFENSFAISQYNTQLFINTNTWNSGAYFVRVYDSGNYLGTVKAVIR